MPIWACVFTLAFSPSSWSQTCSKKPAGLPVYSHTPHPAFCSSKKGTPAADRATKILQPSMRLRISLIFRRSSRIPLAWPMENSFSLSMCHEPWARRKTTTLPGSSSEALEPSAPINTAISFAIFPPRCSFDDQAFHDFPALDVMVHDLGDVAGRHGRVPDVLRVDHDDGAFFAYPETAGVVYEHFAVQLTALDLFHKPHHDVHSFLGMAEPFLLSVGPGAGTYEYMV